MVADVPTNAGPVRVVDPIEIPSNASFDLSSDCGGGHGGRVPNGAKLAFWRREGGKKIGYMRGVFSVGQLLPACGKLYRFAGLLPNGGIVIDKAPAALPKGVSMGADSLVVPLNASGDLGASHVAVESIRSQGKQVVAQVAVKEVEFARGTDYPPTKVDSRTVEVSPGTSLAVLGKTYPVLNVVGPDSVNGLPGWVEIGRTPTRVASP